jgi:hypothetical protein
MLLSVHIAEVSARKAAAALRLTPEPGSVQGLRYARSWLTLPLRAGMMPEMVPTGVLMLAAWDDDESLDKFLSHPRARPYRDGWRTRMIPARSIGTLPGLPDLPRQEQPAGDQPVAAFTLGRLRAGKIIPFLVTSGVAEREARSHPAFIEGVGLFRPPLAAGTFSLWRNVREMRRYALGTYPGGHKKAMAIDHERRFWHEMLFSRHLPYTAEGQWKGRNPLAELEPAAGMDLIGDLTGPHRPRLSLSLLTRLFRHPRRIV